MCPNSANAVRGAGRGSLKLIWTEMPQMPLLDAGLRVPVPVQVRAMSEEHFSTQPCASLIRVSLY